jgi:MinD-like ATPase involved in chromosome partitioning or flagellar assembly
MDLGPRTQSNDLDFFLTADMQVLLSTGEPTSLENLSRVIKALVLRKAQTAFNSLSRETFAQNFDESADSVSFIQNLTRQLRRLQLPADDIFKRVLSSFNIRVIFNMVESADYAKQSHLLNKYLSNELGLTFVVAGSIHHDPVVHEAMQKKDMQRLTTYRSTRLSGYSRITQKLMVTRALVRRNRRSLEPCGPRLRSTNRRSSAPSGAISGISVNSRHPATIAGSRTGIKSEREASRALPVPCRAIQTPLFNDRRRLIPGLTLLSEKVQQHFRFAAAKPL